MQDLDPRVQKAVNRVQSEDITREVAETARALGFKSINMDLMYGLPFQTVKSFDETLEKIFRCQPRFDKVKLIFEYLKHQKCR